MITNVLEWRGIPVPKAIREQINACTDLDQLDSWGQRAVHATHAQQLFTED